MSNEMYNRIMNGLRESKSASHATDKDLEEEAQEHDDERSDDPVVDDIGAPGVSNDEGPVEGDSSDEPSTEEENEEASTPDDDHETDKDLKDTAAKTASVIGELRKSREDLEKDMDALLKAAEADDDEEDPGDSSENGESDSSSGDSDSGSSSDDSGDSDDEDEDDDEESEDEVEDALQAGEDAAEEVAKSIQKDEVSDKVAGVRAAQAVATRLQNDTEMDKVAGIQAARKVATDVSQLKQQERAESMQNELAQQYKSGAEAADMLADGLDQDVPRKLKEEQGLTEEEFQAIAQALMAGKEPETPEEKQVAKILGDSLPQNDEEGQSPSQPEGGESENDLQEQMVSQASTDQASFRQLWSLADKQTKQAWLQNQLQ